MSAIGMATLFQEIVGDDTEHLVATEVVGAVPGVSDGTITPRPIIVHSLVFDVDTGLFINGGDFTFTSFATGATLFTVTIKGASERVFDVPWEASGGLAVTAPTGGSVTVIHSQIGR